MFEHLFGENGQLIMLIIWWAIMAVAFVVAYILTKNKEGMKGIKRIGHSLWSCLGAGAVFIGLSTLIDLIFFR